MRDPSATGHEEAIAGQDDALERAKAAARDGNPRGMIEALYQSAALDGITRALNRKWNAKVSSQEVNDCLAHAVDAVYAQLSQGKKVFNLIAFLWKAAENEVTEMWRRHYSGRSSEEIEKLAVSADEHDESSNAATDPDVLRAEALRIARQFLHQLGEQNVVRVMSFVFEAIEAREIDLPSQVIADALGLRPATVRVLLHRGFDRLARLAKKSGFHIHHLGVIDPETTTNEP